MLPSCYNFLLFNLKKYTIQATVIFFFFNLNVLLDLIFLSSILGVHPNSNFILLNLYKIISRWNISYFRQLADAVVGLLRF